jgi:PEP-CTERM motif-containing protein
MKTAKFVLAIAFGVIALFIPSAVRAATISDTCTTVSVSGGGQLPNIACPTFTGTDLQGIELHITGSFSVASITLLGAASDQTTTVDVNQLFTFSFPTGGGSSTASDLTGTLTVPGGQVFTTFTNPTTTNFATSFDSSFTDSSFFPLYETSIPGSFAVSVSTSSEFLSCSNPAVICGTSNPSQIGATIAEADAGATVTYTFSPSSAVPEPSSLLLLGTGLLGLVGVLRRKCLA